MIVSALFYLLCFALLIFLIYKLFQKVPYLALLGLALPLFASIFMFYTAFRYIEFILTFAILFPFFFLYYPKVQRKQYEKVYTKIVLTLDSFFLGLPILSAFDWFWSLFVHASGEFEAFVLFGPLFTVIFIVPYHIMAWQYLVMKPQS